MHGLPYKVIMYESIKHLCNEKMDEKRNVVKLDFSTFRLAPYV